MGWIVFECLFILAVSGVHQGVSGLKPWMSPEKGEIILEEGDELRIQCEGDSRLQFLPEETPENPEMEYESSYDEGSRLHEFVFKNVSYLNTAWYACAEAGVEFENNNQIIDHSNDDVSWIYVYVKSSKPFPFASPVMFISAVVGRTVVIPCRPTSPDLSVKLQVDFQDNKDPSIPYDPKVGFVLSNVSMIMSGINYGCAASMPDPAEMEPLITLHVTPADPPPTPTIDEKSVRHVVWGENHTFICNATIAPDSAFVLGWRTPESVDKSKISQRTFGPKELGYFPKDNPKKERHSVELTVRDVEISDGGEYVCYIIGPNQERGETPVNITVSDPHSYFINVTIDKSDGTDSSLIVLNESDTAIWKIMIDTYPPMIDWIWFKPNSEEIPKGSIGGSSEKDKYSYSEENMNHFFRISKLELKDNGNYTLKVITREGTKNTTLALRVDAKPLAVIEIPTKYYAPGESAIFTCEVLASPQPNITWTYSEYPNYPSKLLPINAPLGKSDSKPVEGSPHIVKSTLNLTLKKEGDLICEACNSFGCSNATEPIFLSDMGAEAFSISDPGLVTVGDTINLTCSASVYNYTDKLHWSKKQSEKLASGFIIKNRTTNFTHQSTITIHNVSKSHSGDYTCSTLNFENKTDTIHFDLIVKAAQEPKILASNLNGSKVVINLKTEKERSMTLNCNITGMPIPKIIWLKDNEELRNQRYLILKDNTTLHIKYFLDGDSGRYSCRGVNRLGVVERYTDIDVQGAHSQDNLLWISLICVLIIIIIVVITYMGIRVHRERLLRKELCDAGLTHFADGAVECLNPDLPIDDQAELLPYDKKWEFPQDLLKIGKQLGSGAFGVVMKAEARGICTEGEITTVAVKMVRRTAEPSYMRALASELKIMIHLGRHLNVVNLLGACTKNILTKRELYVIVEYCRFGNLHNYLQRHRSSFINQIDPGTNKIDLSIGLERLGRSESVGSQNRLKYADLSFCRSFSVSSAESNSGSELVDYRQVNEFGEISMSPNGGVLSNNSVQPGWRSNYRGDYKDQNLKPICTHDLLCWAWQVSRGMEYLSSRNVLHGDLAARNILLADDNIVKICDFGLAKNMYKDNNYKKKGDGPLPIKWMAIESIRDRIYSTQSDVWSFGIVLWEFFTLACTPYPGMEAETQYDKLIEGYRMPKPEYATDEIYEDIIKDCWKAKPSLRPTFTNLVEKIGTLLNESVKMYYCELDTPYMEMNTAKLQDGQNDYLTMMASPSHDYHNAPEGLSEIRLDSDYLSMSPLKKDSPDSAGIFSPRAELAESHFEFPSQTSNAANVNSDSEDNCVESVPMLTPEEPYLVPVDVHQRRSDFANKQVKSVKPVLNNDYSNLPNNQRTDNSDSENRTPDIMKLTSSDKKIVDKKIIDKNHDGDTVIPIIYSGNDNYVNIPQRNKNNDRINKDHVDSFSNPSYVIMSKLENDSQFV